MLNKWQMWTEGLFHDVWALFHHRNGGVRVGGRKRVWERHTQGETERERESAKNGIVCILQVQMQSLIITVEIKLEEIGEI